MGVDPMSGNVNYQELFAGFRSGRFPNLRASQDAVLSTYSASYTQRPDVAIELPTGAGKSLIALLIGEAWRREGKRVALLTGNKTLARQMKQEADALGVPAVRMEGPGPSIPAADKRAYHRHTSLAIMNYWVYFNQNPVIDAADLLFMDDAHLAEHCLHSLYSVEIDRFQHESLFKAMATELASRFPEYSVLQDALDEHAPNTTPTELFSFMDQSSVAERIRELVDTSPLLQSDQDLRFRWNRIRGLVEEANLYVSTRSMWFRPAVYPLTRNDHYRDCSQRLYMSATIGDTSDLARRLGSDQIEKIPVDPSLAGVTTGRRFLIMNKIDEEDIPARSEHVILAALGVHPKSVWLCSSRAEAEHFREIVSDWLNAHQLVGHPTWILSNLGDEIDEFKQAVRGHLFVGGRFDGMDFKADECRLVILTTLPRAINSQEEFFTAYLRDSGFMLRRLNQRIIQALGRCNRDANDYGVYVLADRRFATHFGRESNRTGIPRNIVAELDCAEDATELPEEELAQQVVAFLDEQFHDYDTNLAEHLAGVPQADVESPSESDVSSHEVEAWAELFDSQDYRSAENHFGECARCASQAQLRELAGFYLWCQAKAAFLHGRQGDIPARNEAPDLLEQAIGAGGQSAWFNRLRSSLNRYRSNTGGAALTMPTDYPFVVVHAFDDILERLGKRGQRFQRWVEAVNGKLDSDSHAQFQQGLHELGTTLSYSAAEPRYTAATDCRWRGIFGNVREIVTFEAKIEQRDGSVLTPTHVGQGHNQFNRARAEYENLGYIVRGTIVTHLHQIDQSAQSSLGPIRIIRKSAIRELWNRVMRCLTDYRDRWSLEDADARLIAAERASTRLPPSGWLSRALESDEVWIDADRLLAEWP
jgi:hypothetical protein